MNLNLVRRFFKFTVPSIVSMWIFSLYSLVDGMFVGTSSANMELDTSRHTMISTP